MKIIIDQASPGPRTPVVGKTKFLPPPGVRGLLGLAAEIVRDSMDLALLSRMCRLTVDL